MLKRKITEVVGHFFHHNANTCSCHDNPWCTKSWHLYKHNYPYILLVCFVFSFRYIKRFPNTYIFSMKIIQNVLNVQTKGFINYLMHGIYRNPSDVFINYKRSRSRQDSYCDSCLHLALALARIIWRTEVFAFIHWDLIYIVWLLLCLIWFNKHVFGCSDQCQANQILCYWCMRNNFLLVVRNSNKNMNRSVHWFYFFYQKQCIFQLWVWYRHELFWTDCYFPVARDKEKSFIVLCSV